MKEIIYQLATINQQTIYGLLMVIILAVFVGIFFVLKLMRNMPFMNGGGYAPMPMYPQGNYRTASNSSNYDFTMFLILLAGAAGYLLLSMSPNQTFIPIANNKIIETPTEENVSKGGGFTLRTIPVSPPPPVEEVTKEKEYTEDRGTNQGIRAEQLAAIKNYDYALIPLQNTEYLTLQLDAFSFKNNADKAKDDLETIHPIVYIVEDAGFYKVTVGLFNNETELNQYRQDYDLKGQPLEIVF